MSVPRQETIPARHGSAVRLVAQQSLKIHNSHGNQVVDTWAFTVEGPESGTFSSYMSMSQTRSAIRKLCPEVNDTLVTNLCHPILTMVEDTANGTHDTLFPACNPQRYAHLGAPHRSCAENCREASAAAGIILAEGQVPDPFNLFMNVEVDWKADFGIQLREPLSRPGSHVTLRAEVDCVVVMSACPNDITMVNGKNCRDVVFEVF
ncbi:hypothetical protein BT63DRAFT_63543 [Microthyrium microscopicum]|uniref:DUF1989 domain-containing protein n=1 Tax=Microthyrium microscopicum TaxID=703497 RepID=A0A6A6U161_9PEZI|nr:hypothetical protein BT63DRAFT_63543 [Microthyrium microscopicum]